MKPWPRVTLTPQTYSLIPGTRPQPSVRDRRFTLQRVDGPVDQDSRLVASHPAAADAREMGKSLLALPTSAVRLFSLLTTSPLR